MIGPLGSASADLLLRERFFGGDPPPPRPVPEARGAIFAALVVLGVALAIMAIGWLVGVGADRRPAEAIWNVAERGVW